LGIQNKYGLFPAVLPKILFNTNSNTDMRIESFNVVSSYQGEEITIPSSIVLPDLWYFEEKVINREDGKESNFKQFVISDFRQNIQLIITPRSVNKSRSIRSATTEVTFTQEIRKKYVADYPIVESDRFESVSIYRVEINENEMKYVQKVESGIEAEKESEILNEFIVFNRQDGFHDEESFVWDADIRLKIDESVSEDERLKLIETANEVVSSLQVRE
jgi:hypothetical protein